MDRQKSAPEDKTIPLSDGRRLGYAEYGVPNGIPVLFFHGMPGSSYIHADMAVIAAQRDIRLIAVDRPGYGLSDPHPGRTLPDWADDIAALTDRLGIGQFSIVGFSGGSPYALACASRFPTRISRLALAGPFAPLDAPGVMSGMSPSSGGLFSLAQSNPEELKKVLSPLTESPAVLLGAMSASLPEWDKHEVNQRIAEFTTEYTQTLRGGIEGIISDFALISGNWGFTLDNINTGTHLWCGTADCNTPLAMTAYLSSILPNCHTFMLPDEGHLSLYVHWEEILERLVQ